MTLTRFRFIACAALLLLLAGCATPGGKLQRAGQAQAFDIALDSPLDWARIKGYRSETWTIDGQALNQLNIYSQIKPGEHVMLRGKQKKSRPDGPWFKAGMRGDEIRDIVVDAYRELSWTRISTQNLRPADFAGTAGYRFDLVMTEPNGLVYQGTAAVAVRDGNLDLLVWIAPREHYYGRDIDEVNSMLDRMRFM